MGWKFAARRFHSPVTFQEAPVAVPAAWIFHAKCNRISRSHPGAIAILELSREAAGEGGKQALWKRDVRARESRSETAAAEQEIAVQTPGKTWEDVSGGARGWIPAIEQPSIRPGRNDQIQSPLSNSLVEGRGESSPTAVPALATAQPLEPGRASRLQAWRRLPVPAALWRNALEPDPGLVGRNNLPSLLVLWFPRES